MSLKICVFVPPAHKQLGQASPPAFSAPHAAFSRVPSYLTPGITQSMNCTSNQLISWPERASSPLSADTELNQRVQMLLSRSPASIRPSAPSPSSPPEKPPNYLGGRGSLRWDFSPRALSTTSGGCRLCHWARGRRGLDSMSDQCRSWLPVARQPRKSLPMGSFLVTLS